MIRTNQPFDLALWCIANHRPTMAAYVVNRARLALLIPRDNDGIRIDFDGEVVPAIWNLTRVPSKKPTCSPHALAIALVHLLIGVKLSQQAVSGGLAGEQVTNALWEPSIAR